MNVFHTIADFRAYRRALGLAATTPFVPTMGALHEGHASLVRDARKLADAAPGPKAVLASIFVNPTQFGPGEDFSRYPRTLDADIAILTAAGCDALFVPSAQEIYPGISGLSTDHLAAMTSVDPGPLASVLEGAIRPGHFRGVCTVVATLLHITEPSHMIMGQKDYQQQAVLRRMCADLHIPTEVVTAPTIREPDGLAMSSRNRYLSPEERPRAAAIYQALTLVKQAYAMGERDPRILEAAMEDRLTAHGLTPQYAVIANANTLALFHDHPTPHITTPAVALIAAKLGPTRLIDNLVL